jgi:broad specificity phosphatase PhoE
MRIALVRHAPVRFSSGKWVWPRGVCDAVADYNQAPVIPSVVPRELEVLVQSASVVLASSLTRSIRTAELLSRGREVIWDSIYDEAALPSPRGTVPLLPIRAWFIVLRALWLLNWAGGTESKSEALARAQVAAKRLVLAAEPDKLVVLVGHGIFMALVSRALESMGWSRLDPLPRRPWSACRLVSPELSR